MSRLARNVQTACVAMGLALTLWVLAPQPARAFGDEGAFDPRPLLAGGLKDTASPNGASRWAWELVQRTSAPARLRTVPVRADDPAMLRAPFATWSSTKAGERLSTAEVANLRRYFALGGILLIDDPAPAADGTPSAFGEYAKREIARVLPEASPIELDGEHVLYRTFYLLRRAVGRVEGRKTARAIVQSGKAQVIFLENDLTGALAKGPTGAWEQTVLPGGETQREEAVRFAVNIAMYVLCSNYKDDQVHAPFLMRKRAVLHD